jgi:hypothetical protein
VSLVRVAAVAVITGRAPVAGMRPVARIPGVTGMAMATGITVMPEAEERHDRQTVTPRCQTKAVGAHSRERKILRG